MRRAASSKQKPVYPKWSARDEHEHGIPLNEAFQEFIGEASVINRMRHQIEQAPADLSEIQRKSMWSHYWAAVRTTNHGFADRVAKEAV